MRSKARLAEKAKIKKMEQNFISLRKNGFSIREIADIYGLCNATIYNHLGHIAYKNGVTVKYLKTIEAELPKDGGVVEEYAKLLRTIVQSKKEMEG